MTVSAPFQIEVFQDALEYVGTVRMLKDDLPDGQWVELRENIREYFDEYGKDMKSWPIEVKEQFKEDCISNMYSWM